MVTSGKLHGGSVAVWSAGPGRGSEFTVRLSAVTAPGVPGADAEPAAPLAVRRRRVLVMEDSPDARHSLRLLLEMAGHQVETSEDGSDGLAKVRAYRPDVALIDLGLPGMDGHAVAQEIRRQGETRDVRLEYRRRALAAGFDLHVTKPADPGLLDELLRPA